MSTRFGKILPERTRASSNASIKSRARDLLDRWKMQFSGTSSSSLSEVQRNVALLGTSSSAVAAKSKPVEAPPMPMFAAPPVQVPVAVPSSPAAKTTPVVKPAEVVQKIRKPKKQVRVEEPVVALVEIPEEPPLLTRSNKKKKRVTFSQNIKFVVTFVKGESVKDTKRFVARWNLRPFVIFQPHYPSSGPRVRGSGHVRGELPRE
jgi:hypothetical protein